LFGEDPNAQSGIDKPDSPTPVGDVRMFGNSDPLTALFSVGFGEPVFGTDEEEEGEDP